MNGLFSFFEMKLASRYSVSDVLRALDVYTDRKSDIPAPADIIQILSPEPAKVSQAAFIEAQDWQKRNNNWSPYTDAAEIIAKYRNEQLGYDDFGAGNFLAAPKPEHTLEATQEAPQKRIVSWYGKMWPELTADEKEQVRGHIMAMATNNNTPNHGLLAAQNYCMYLNNMCGAPRGLFKQIFNKDEI